ncbi:MAG: rod shape-determining protein [Patescibacteria group bacterium]
MFKGFLGRFSKDLGIDLGTANTLVYTKDRGIVINEPSIVAINQRTDQILAVGEEARKMIGKTPPYIVAIKPLADGVVSDFEAAEKMMKHFIEKVHRESANFLPRPRVVMAIPLGVTEVERKAAEDAALNAGARQVFLIEEPMAAAIGARLPVQESIGNMIIDIGGGTTEIAVISLGGVVNWRSLRLAGDELNQDIINYCRDKFNLLIGERTAEDIKIKIGNVIEQTEIIETTAKGRDLLTGLPKEITINNEHVHEAMNKTINTIIDNVKSTIESTPPELVADIFERGLVLSGGGALLTGLDIRIERATQVPVKIVDDPLTAVVRGTGIVLEDMELFKNALSLTSEGNILD